MADLSDDSMGSFYLNAEIKSLTEFNSRLQQENNKLREDQITANARECELTSIIQRLNFELDHCKKDIDDLNSRILISDSLRSDAQKAAANSLHEEHFFRKQETGELKSTIAKLETQNRKLEEELATSKHISEKASNDAVFNESLLSKILSQSSLSFSTNFQTVDQLLAFLVAKPYFDAQRKSEFEKLKTRELDLKKKIRKYKARLEQSCLENEKLEQHIQQIQSDFKNKEQSFEREIENAEKEMLGIQKSHERKLTRLKQEFRNAQFLNKKPRLYIYKEPTITIAPVKKEDDMLEEKLKIMKVHYKEAMRENEQLKDQIEAFVKNTKDLETMIANLEVQKSSIEINMAEANTQLEFLRNNTEAGETERKNLKCKLKAAKKRSDADAQTIESQQRRIAELTSEVQLLHEKITHQSSQIHQLLVTKVEEPSHQPEPVKLEPVIVRPVSEELAFRDCYTDELPGELEGEIRRIIENDCLQTSSKLKNVMKSLASHFNHQIASLSKRLATHQSQADHVNTVLSDFIPSLASALLKEHLNADDFLVKSNMRARLLAAARKFSENSFTVARSRDAVEELQSENTRLTEKVKKYRHKERDGAQEILRLAAQSRTLQARTEQLEEQVRSLTAQKKELRESMEQEQREHAYMLQSLKEASTTEYEEMIEQLQKRCNEQRETIKTLSRQISVKNC